MARITEAAQASFAENGWAGTSLRGVARVAGVDPALVHYYYGSKEELLDASTMPPPEWLQAIADTHEGPLRSRGERILRNTMWSWTQPGVREVLSSILLIAAHEPRTREKLRGFITTSLLPAVAERLPEEERTERAALVASQVFGLVMMRYMWRIEPLASMSEDEVVARIAPSLQRYLTGSLR
jgi:AcrR family transcriptional regulator